MTMTLDRAARATGGEIINAAAFPAGLRIVTDTRTLQQGDAFLALRGDRFDGHAYVREAITKGASAAIVEDRTAVPEGVAALVVGDTKRAYMNLARAAREDFSGRVIGIPGSAGKTTTKHLLAQLLGFHFGQESILATPANENNEIGVSRLLLRAGAHHRVIVVEMGARHDGEIAELVEIAEPHAGVLTNIGEAHLEIFGSRERLARTKWGLFSQGAQAVLNARDPESVTRSAALPSPPLWFGAGEPGLPGVWVRDAHTVTLNYEQPHRELRVNISIPGTHNRANLAAAFAAALICGVPAGELAGRLVDLTLPAGRFERIEMRDGVHVIYDAYNANLSGMLAAIEAFAAEAAQRRIAVLASMAELGCEAPAMHERVGALAARMNLDTVLLGGEFAGSMRAGALAAGFSRDRLVDYSSNAEAAQWIRAHAREGDLVLLKGSRKYAMEQIVQELRG